MSPPGPAKKRSFKRRASRSGKCFECPAMIVKNHHWVILDFDTGQWIHLECFKKKYPLPAPEPAS